ncbi:hypothetical protein WOLCODRAFT_164374 [Wolfiporia cocos MD-104 SS10]|uniref:Uncharacterized protein n=1 Tax=Wolfiporia cocos (strain MD-104) TaxID=742152 RepID=A0A2H3JTN5_WOLCO|nr:hypothetical protein WOLCODRAFT_164374 [Wolfiporia cocos MD-104 SS10]
MGGEQMRCGVKDAGERWKALPRMVCEEKSTRRPVRQTVFGKSSVDPRDARKNSVLAVEGTA